MAWPPTYYRKDGWQYPHTEAALATPHPPQPPAHYGGFPFPLELGNKRAPLPPRYSHQDLEDLLRSSTQEPPPAPNLGEYMAISYYHSRIPRGSARPLSLHLSRTDHRAGGLAPAPPHYASSDQVESDYGSCEEVMF